MKILDCTLRDGGYYTNWDFSKELVNNYLKSFNDLPADYLEIGYRSNPMNEYLGEYFYCPVYLLEEIRSLSKKKLVIILNEKDVRPEHVSALLSPCIGLIDMVRIALDPQYLGRALKLAAEIKKLNFEVGFNIMYMSKWKNYGGFLDEIKYVDEVADYFYMVDSYGGVYPGDVIETIKMVKERTTCPIGFHGHNNMELGLINSLTAIEHGAEIIDVTITGMGRGAGNLKTELLLTALNAKEGLEVDFNTLSILVDSFEKLQKQYSWGSNLPYMVSGANSLPQKDVMEWVSRRFYSFNSIIRALQNQKKGIKDNEQLPLFEPSEKFTNAIVIGGGPNGVQHATGVLAYLEKNPDSCIIHASSKNASYYKSANVPQFFCLVGNEGHRLEKIFTDLGGFNGKCVLPPFPRKMGTYIPATIRDNTFELDAIDFTSKLADTHTALALKTSLQLNAKNIMIVGYDGYQDSSLSQQERSLSEENEYLFTAFQNHHPEIKIEAITPTNYKTLPVTSVYQYLV
ncbi:aldolase catalytic domain-containing protein [Pedobacter metabolipauper]|uniref:4-hydroxy 2-oxovalerate aldolase n=1 Tax=Pedobacter metabolipauper TaxID=425513 RepID=A0A4R6SWY0_9SPHI|nr:aldolase catalytic domain-containing protein [Pedobacter metabolipauper]TDQ09929.1 4-hydroxy 2-oxovalerate aldolase [Pedobacter metabolipauper]